MKREELLNSKEYWLSKIQIDLFNEIEKIYATKWSEPDTVGRKNWGFRRVTLVRY